MNSSPNTDIWVRLLQLFGFFGFLSILSRLTDTLLEISGFLNIVLENYRYLTSPATQIIKNTVGFLINYEITSFTADYILFGFIFSGILIRKLLWGVNEVPYVDLVDRSRHSQLYINTMLIGVLSICSFVLFILFSLLWPITLPNMIANYLRKKPTLIW